MSLRSCNQCGVEPGAFHGRGCSVERCSLCGVQRIMCNCVYVLNGIDPETMEDTHPEIYERGPTDEMYAPYDAEVERLGGRRPWSGEYPDCDACREFDLWCRWIDGRGWIACEKEHPDATENLNRLHLVAEWDRVARKWVRRFN